jgi:hypothetical protein
MRGQIVEESRATIDDSDLVKGEQSTEKDYILRPPASTALAPPANASVGARALASDNGDR